jgi:hypothetical protein
METEHEQLRKCREEINKAIGLARHYGDHETLPLIKLRFYDIATVLERTEK